MLLSFLFLLQALAEGLLTFFVGKEDKESFAATLYTCYTLIRPDVAMELAWRHRLTDYIMPYMLQYIRDTNARIAKLEERTKPAADKQAGHGVGASDEIDPHAPGLHGYMGPTGMLAIADTPFNAPPPMGGMPGMAGGGMMPPGMMPPPMAVPGMGMGMPPPTMGGYGGYQQPF